MHRRSGERIAHASEECGFCIDTLVHRNGATVVASFDYDRAPGGEPTRVTRESGAYVEYAYDSAWRLTLERSHDVAGSLLQETSYTYDSDGVRTSKNSDVYSYGAGFRLASAGPEALSHDAAGRVTSVTRSSGTLGFTYDSHDRLTSTTVGTDNWAYGYDGENRRIRQTRGGAEYHYAQAPASGGDLSAPHAIVSGAATVASFVYAGSRPLSKTTPSGTFYYLEDGGGNVVGLTSAAGASVATFSRDAFGNPNAGSDPIPAEGEFGFQGHWHDPTGLIHMRARQYDPITGTFLTKDSAEPVPALPESFSPYGFAFNNPVVFDDPTGRFTLTSTQVGVAIQASLTLTAVALENRLLGDRAGSQIRSASIGRIFDPPVSDGQVEELERLNRTGERFDVGNYFEVLMIERLCQTGQSNIYITPSVNPDTGKPTTDGFKLWDYLCDDPSSAIFRSYSRQSGYSRGDVFPDFIVSETDPTDLNKRDLRSDLVGEIKLTLKWPRPSQLSGIVNHAADYTFYHQALFVVYETNEYEVVNLDAEVRAIAGTRPVWIQLAFFSLQ